MPLLLIMEWTQSLLLELVLRGVLRSSNDEEENTFVRFLCINFLPFSPLPNFCFIEMKYQLTFLDIYFAGWIKCLNAKNYAICYFEENCTEFKLFLLYSSNINFI